MDIEEEPLDTVDIVEVAMNNDKNEFIKMILQKMKSTSKC